jgi:hypothetical protein
MTKSAQLANNFVRASIARQKASQLEADVVEPNTIAVARLNNSSAMKLNAPVMSAWIRANRKHALISAKPRKILAVG